VAGRGLGKNLLPAAAASILAATTAIFDLELTRRAGCTTAADRFGGRAKERNFLNINKI